jgi:hypothetical protein
VIYAPDRTCVELKSLKLYLWSFRDEGHFFEQATNQILDDLVKATRPRFMTVIGKFNVRGGIGTTVVARYARPPPVADGEYSRPTAIAAVKSEPRPTGTARARLAVASATGGGERGRPYRHPRGLALWGAARNSVA